MESGSLLQHKITLWNALNKNYNKRLSIITHVMSPFIADSELLIDNNKQFMPVWTNNIHYETKMDYLHYPVIGRWM